MAQIKEVIYTKLEDSTTIHDTSMRYRLINCQINQQEYRYKNPSNYSNASEIM